MSLDMERAVKLYGPGELPKNVRVLRYPPGTEAPNPKAGDIGLTRSHNLYSKAIRLGEGLAGEWGFNAYNHAFIVRHDDGTIVEALSRGPVQRHISCYTDMPYCLVREPYEPYELEQGEAFLNQVLEDKWGYDWLAIASSVPYLLSGGRVMFAAAGSNIICSALAAEYKVRTKNEYFEEKHAVFIWPSNLARHYNVVDEAGR